MSGGRISQRDSQEVTALFMAVAADLYCHALVLTQGHRECADDLVQDAFEAAAADWAKIRTRDHEDQRRWLFTVVRNKAVDQWRRERRLVTLAEAAEAASQQVIGDETYDQVVTSLDAGLCWKVLRDMPPGRYRVAVLAWHFRWTTQEIAERFDLTPSTVRVHLSRARRELREKLGLGGTRSEKGRD